MGEEKRERSLIQRRIRERREIWIQLGSVEKERLRRDFAVLILRLQTTDQYKPDHSPTLERS